MKALIGSGFCLALAFVSTRSFAEEIHWRPSLPILGTPAPAGAAVIPASYTAPVTTPTTSIGIGLGSPIATSAPGDGSDPSATEARPKGLTLDRPQPLIRAQAADSLTQPLPVGLPLQGDGTQGNRKGNAVPSGQGAKPGPIIMESDFVPPMPRVMQSAPAARVTAARPFGRVPAPCRQFSMAGPWSPWETAAAALSSIVATPAATAVAVTIACIAATAFTPARLISAGRSSGRVFRRSSPSALPAHQPA